MICCLDTNSILDFCYRYYPQAMFGSLWESLDAAILANQIKFVIAQHIYTETTDKISYMGYDRTVFDAFLAAFRVQIIGGYDADLSALKADLMSITTAITAQRLSHLDNDLSSICVSRTHGCTVITSEQGFNNDIATATNIRNLKIPDICRHFNISCGSWLIIFKTIGFRA
ncbi:DUF4411 family protein [Moraxella sp. ZJ142]|uniref:DUF4411 family protein n=1 Tax=Moraxella marmotae TaxID=3344520 RepID=UPI0035D46FDD